MSTLSLDRFLDLPPDASSRGLVLRYGYQRGMMLIYRYQVTIYRTSSTSTRTGAPPHEELEARLRVKILDIDETDKGARLIVYYEPRHHRVGTRNVAPSDPTIVYTKQNEFGEVIESTDPSGGVNLMLPRMAVSAGTTWREVERFVPAGHAEAVEIVRNYHIGGISAGQVDIRFKTDELTYGADGVSTEYTLGGKGEFSFDTQWGVVTRQTVESTMASQVDGFRFEIQTVHEMGLMDDE